jgi:hypothetical protein
MHGAVFAIMVQGFWTTGAIAVQGLGGATFESRYRMLLTSSVSVSGFNCREGFIWGAGLKAKTVTNK